MSLIKSYKNNTFKKRVCLAEGTNEADQSVGTNGFYNQNNITTNLINSGGNASNPLFKKSFGKRFFASNYTKVFLIAFVITLIFFLPSVIQGHGVFTYYGDYVVQQIPFYKHCHQMVRDGSIFWDWGTDLGANFIGSYSFYLFGSPFFWLTIPFPNEWLPYMMAPLYCLKFAVAALTSYAYIQRFVKNKNYAIIGALLYAFSGFQIFNIFFNHFHDVVAFFPLLLIGIEEVIVNNKRGPFLLAVFINCTISYFFFAGQITFVVMYFFVRVTMCHNWRITVKKFLILAFESIVGVAMSAVILLPAVLAILGNPRLDSGLYGYNLIFYNNVQRYGAIIQSFLFPAELASRPNFFEGANVKWASVAGWFPLISLSGVMAYLCSKKRTWLKGIIVACIVAAFVPGFNSAFFAFNGTYYARWFYMAILMFAVATVVSMEDKKINFMKGFRITAIMTGLIIAVVGFFPTNENDIIEFGLYKDAGRFYLSSAIAVASLIGTYVIFKYLRKHKNFFKITIGGVAIFSIIAGLALITTGRTISSNHEWVVKDLIETQLTRDILGEKEDAFFRVDFPSSFDNLGMYWDYPSLSAFHSIVPQSITEYYTSVGVPRGVASRPELKFSGVRGMTSVKYYFEKGNGNAADPMPGFKYKLSSNGVRVFENKEFVPIGFTYDTYISQGMYKALADGTKDKAMMNSILLSDEQIKEYDGLLKKAQVSDISDASDEKYLANCVQRQKNHCETFQRDNTGFSATIDMEKDNLVFFSVPYEKGWSATVNGIEAEIEEVNVGFMAVRVPAGADNAIRFNYFTPGLKIGLITTFSAIVIFALYMLIYFRSKKKKIAEEKPSYCSENTESEIPDGCMNCRRCYKLEKYNEPVLIEPEVKPFILARLFSSNKTRKKMNYDKIDNQSDDNLLEDYYKQMLSGSSKETEGQLKEEKDGEITDNSFDFPKDHD